MVAACQRRSGNYQQALEEYKAIHRKFPDDVECKYYFMCISLFLTNLNYYFSYTINLL